jgi:hypothetical protein
MHYMKYMGEYIQCLHEAIQSCNGYDFTLLRLFDGTVSHQYYYIGWGERTDSEQKVVGHLGGSGRCLTGDTIPAHFLQTRQQLQTSIRLQGVQVEKRAVYL